MMLPNSCPGASMRHVDRIFEDAQLKGVLQLNCRKLKEFPKVVVKYDLSDVIKADLSKNRLSEVPEEICFCPLLEDLDCYGNVIRSIPEVIINLHSLAHLNLSRNQLCVFPPSLCRLPLLQVLTLRNNRILAIPEEISHMKCLRDLDVSCNEITIVPPQLGSVTSLQRLNLKRNLLLEIPLELCQLRLLSLDVSANRISCLPTQLRHMTSLQELHLQHNPLTFPPAVLCKRGRIHVFKFLEIQAIKEDKRGIVLETEFQKFRSPSVLSEARFQNGFGGCRKSYTFDSGYSTSDGDTRSQESQELKKYSMDSPRWEQATRNQNTNTLFNYIPNPSGKEEEDVQTFREYKEALKRRREAVYKKNGDEESVELSPKSHAAKLQWESSVEENPPGSPIHHAEEQDSVPNMDRKISFAEKKSTDEVPLNNFSWPKNCMLNAPAKPSKSSFTMKREFDKAREEQELVRQLRETLESRLKLRLPDDLEDALGDGVFLCHLANHLKPNAVSCVHVPSPAVPKLTIAKCRRNADNFLEACRRLGVPNELLCSPQDILGEQGGLVRIAITVQEMTSAPPETYKG
ncbi:hypothetical protein JTE90_013514 [Oedothorax gibbosus]|uniref:Calponin-homology (CH) domain-containing protein n=1 Tax=Oedothorax gibbosus TaxID=931172 RepID=A0AAV6VMY0_9ARAC|nr:hypothetical protein JTE90_013514 [Oedothorax gibbosus]